MQLYFLTLGKCVFYELILKFVEFLLWNIEKFYDSTHWNFDGYLIMGFHVP